MRKRRRVSSADSASSKLRKLPFGCSGDDHGVREVPGRIASLQLSNFMCHANVKIDFDLSSRNCFLIGGCNGSGKSALFAALNIGLGGRGSMNERGNALKQYIKDGQNRAKIRIVLTNTGFGRHPKYGDAIAVERTMSLTSSTYQLKSISYEGGRCCEKVVSQKKADLEQLLAKFSIQLDNAIFWMSQNRCREFLQELKPTKLYKMFMYATGLDSSRLWYDEGSTYIAESERLMLSVQQACNNKKKEIEKLEDDRKRMQSMEENKRSLEELSKIFIWLPVRDCHKDLCRHMELLAKADAVYINLKEGFIAKQAMKSEFSRKLYEMRELKSRQQREIEQLNAELNEYEKEKNCRREELLDTGQRLSASERKQKEIDAEICSMEQQLREIEAKKNQDSKMQHNVAEVEAQLFDLDKRCTNIKVKQHLSEEIKQRLEMKLKETLKAERSLEAEISHWNSTLRELLDEKQRVEAMKQSDLARFGASIPQIVKLIDQNANKFLKKPIGPIGAYVEIVDESWSIAVEQCLRGLLSVFLCDNAKDRNVLESLLRIHNILSRKFIITKFTNTRYNTATNEPPSEFLTVAKMIAVKDNDVFNALIDHTQMESVLLIESDRVARTLMAQNPPKNVRKGFTKSGDEVYAKTESQPYRFYVNNGKQMSSALISGKAVVNIRTLNKEIVKAEDELQKKSASLSKLREDHQKLEIEINNEAQQISRTVQQLQIDEAERRSLQKYLDAARFDGNVDGQVMNLISNLDGYRRQKEILSQSCKTLRDELTILRQKTHEVEADRVEKAKDLSLKKKELKKNEIDEEEYSSKLHQIEENEKDHRLKLERLKNHKDDLENKLSALKEKFEQMKKEIDQSVFSDPLDFTKLPDTEEAENRRKQLKRYIKAAQESLEGTIVSEEALNVLRNEYELLRKKYIDAKRVVLKSKDRIKLRNEKFLEVRNITAEHLNEVYSRLMSIRNFKGSLIVDHDEQTLHIMAKTLKNQKTSQVASSSHHQGIGSLQDLKGLSGGERTYTSACFIMALWEAMETPFRCMDEFDVFLDMNNRKIVMELFADLATRQYPSHQFLFFTPQGIADFAHRDRVQLFELPKVRN